MYKAETPLLICQKSGAVVGFLGNKSPMYKTLQRRSCYLYKMIVAWCGVRLGRGGWEGSKEEGPDGIPSKVGQGHRAIAATAGWCDPEQVVSLTLVSFS